MKKSILVILSCLMFSFIGCSKEEVSVDDLFIAEEEIENNVEEEIVKEEVEEEVDYSKETNPIATIDVNNYGVIKVELYPDVAPNTVNNFIELSNNKFYDGLTFHRVVADFIIQGGDPFGDGTGNAGYTINGEFELNEFENNLSHEIGTISMARTLDNDSASSQFFIATGDATVLDGEYASFGKVIEGLDILDKIDDIEVDENSVPTSTITINSISVDTKGIVYEKAIRN